MERASATPVAPGGPGGRSRKHRTEAPVDLATLQGCFLEAVAWPGSLRGGLQAVKRRTGHDLSGLCTSGPQTSVQDRLAVYHFAYRIRLVEALADDFPTLQYAMGHDAFHTFAEAVVARSPSRTPNLNQYGRVVVEALEAGTVRSSNRAFYLALARLEWALVEAVHAATPPRLNPAELAAIAPERWPNLVFRPSPSLRLLRSEWPANRFLQAYRRDENPSIPQRSPSATAVYRHGYTVWRMDLSPLTHGLLDRLISGVPLGEALAPVEGKAGSDQVMRWFEAWVSGGVFASVEDR